MDLNEITPERTAETVEQYVTKMRDISQYTKQFYASMRDQMVQFCAGLDDRCIEAGIDSFASAILSTLADQMVEIMRGSLNNYASQFVTDLEFLKKQTAGKIFISPNLGSSIQSFVIPEVIETWEPFKKQFQNNQEHRKKEKKEVKERLESRAYAIKMWNEEQKLKSNKAESKSIETVLQELCEEYLQNKNYVEFTPEYVSEAINKAVCDMERISNLTKRHYTEMANLQIQFNMEYDDLCIEAGLPSHSVVNLNDFEELMPIMMRDALCHCSSYFGDELDYIRSRCKTDIDLTAAFWSRIEPFVQPTLDQTWNPVLTKRADHARYRKAEKEELDDRYSDHKEKFELWTEEQKEKKMENSLEMRDGLQQYIDTIVQKKKSTEEHELLINDAYRRLRLFRDSIVKAADYSLRVCRDSCKELIEMCVEWQIHDSAQLVKGLTKAQMDALKAYEMCAFGILEKICGRLSLELTIADADYWKIRARTGTQNTAPVIVEAFNMLRDAYYNNLTDVESYDVGKRAEIDVQFKQLKKASEELSIRNLERKCPTIDLSPFAREQIGRGGEATVFKCNIPGSFFTKSQDMVTVVCKKFECSDVAKGTDEILTLSKLNHPNVVKFMGRGIVDNQRYLLLEFCPRSLSKCIETCRSDGSFIKDTDFVKWATELAAALEHIHSNGHVHGDVKPDNILIGGNNELKLADFGISPPVNSYSMELLTSQKFSKGTPRYMAPEQFSGMEFTFVERSKCDVWAYGICLWEMMTCQPPYGHVTEPAALIQLIGKKKEHPPIPGVSNNCETLGDLLRMCWISRLKDRHLMKAIEQKLPDVREEIEEESAQDPDGYWPSECAKWAQVGRRWAEAVPISTYGYAFLHFAHSPASGNDDSDSKE